ncbi:Hypothetical predicted protein [Pelobates cultripes]|uniref:Uncharacterized protein n=1 Tax=Pelobates cultripes TaxID=61616 RepID=A0AAD1VY54_PELCU|nr:Hypothetical predicted protein [Pelobates cultripes]
METGSGSKSRGVMETGSGTECSSVVETGSSTKCSRVVETFSGTECSGVTKTGLGTEFVEPPSSMSKLSKTAANDKKDKHPHSGGYGSGSQYLANKGAPARWYLEGVTLAGPGGWPPVDERPKPGPLMHHRHTPAISIHYEKQFVQGCMTLEGESRV